MGQRFITAEPPDWFCFSVIPAAILFSAVFLSASLAHWGAITRLPPWWPPSGC
jgi:hypothetical protein